MKKTDKGFPLGRFDHLEGHCYGFHSKSRLTETTMAEFLKEHPGEDIVIQEATEFHCEGGDWLEKMVKAGKAKVMTQEEAEKSIKGIQGEMDKGGKVMIVIDSCSTVQEAKDDSNNRDAK